MTRQSDHIGKSPITGELEQDPVASGCIVPFDTEVQRTVPREPLLLRTHEAAGLLNISVRKVEKMCKSGELPSVRFGRALRIPKWSVLRYAEFEDL